MTEPTDAYGRPEGAALPAPADPYAQPPDNLAPYPYPYSHPHSYPYGPAPGYPVAPYPYVDPVTGLPLSDKSRVAAGVLSILLGAFGAGRFYTGHYGIAIAQIAVTWLTCGLGHIWPLIDGILVLAQGGTDANGRVLRP